MKNKYTKRSKSSKTSKKLIASKRRDANISKMLVKLRSEFGMSGPYLSDGAWVTEDDLMNEELEKLLRDIENLKRESEDFTLTHETGLSINNKLTEKVRQAQDLLEKQKTLPNNLPFAKRNWSFVIQQVKLNLLLNRVKIQPGDALCDVNVLIEGSTVCSYGDQAASPRKTEMYFASLLQLLSVERTCALQEERNIGGNTE